MQDKAAECLPKGGSIPEGATNAKVPPGLKDTELVSLLQGAAKHKVLKVRDVREAFGGFADAGDQDK